MDYIHEIGKRAKSVSTQVQHLSQNQKNEGEKDYDKKTFNHNTCSSINSGAYGRRSGRMRQPAALGFSRGHGTDGDPGEGRGDLPESKS